MLWESSVDNGIILKILNMLCTCNTINCDIHVYIYVEINSLKECDPHSYCI